MLSTSLASKMRLSFTSLIHVLLTSLYLRSEAATDGWNTATATWYGDVYGAGSEGGACGFQSIVKQPPFNSIVSAGSPVIFQGGKGCGACYKVKCTEKDVCTGKPSTVVITDECPEGGVCGGGKTHFDLSGAAINSIAIPGRDADLRKIGVIPILFQRTPCQYPGVNINFHVDAGANNYYFSVFIQYIGGDGSLGKVELRQANSNSWQNMRQVWGVDWALNSADPLQGPFSLRLTTLSGKKRVTANNVIPKNWYPNGDYKSKTQMVSVDLVSDLSHSLEF